MDAEIIEHLDLSEDEGTEKPTETNSINSEVPTGEEAETGAPEEVEKPKEEQLPKGVTKRFAAMTRQKAEMQREIDELKANQKSNHKEPELNRDDYTDDEWMELQIDKKAQALFDKRDEAMQSDNAQKAASSKASEAWGTKLQSFQEEMPNYTEVVSSLDVEFPADVLQEITESAIGPRIAFHLASNPDEAYSILEMTKNQRTKHMWKLEAKLEAVEPKAKETATTNASPTPKNRGKGRARVSESSMSIDDWMKARSRKVHG